MPTKAHAVEAPSASDFHVLDQGRDDEDRQKLLSTLGEACQQPEFSYGLRLNTD